MSHQYDIEIPVPAVRVDVKAVVHRPDGVNESTFVLLLGHGVSNDLNHPLIRHTLERLAERGVAGVRFNFPFKERGDSKPDSQEVLLDTFTAVVNMVHDRFLGDPPLILGGKSLGARVAAAHQVDHRLAHGMVYLGFPLHSPNDKSRLGGDDLLSIRVPQLCLQGDRDPFCDLALFEKVHQEIRSSWRLEVFPDGGHGLGLDRQPPGEDAEEILDRVVDLIVSWARDLPGS